MLKDRLRKQVMEWCDKTYPKKLEIFRDDRFRPLFNNRCQMNSSALVAQGDSVAIVECVIINAEDCTLHYINLDDQGRYFDATLGHEYLKCDYRLIRIYRELPMFSGDHLTAEKKRICLEALGKWKYKLNDPLDML